MKSWALLLIYILLIGVISAVDWQDLNIGMKSPYWKFDETSGTNVEDSTGGGVNGVTTGFPLFVPGLIGNAIELQGNDSVHSNGFFNDDAFSISFWFKPNFAANVNQHRYIFGTSADEGKYYFVKNGNSETITIAAGGKVIFSEIPISHYWTTDNYMHIVIVAVSGGNRFYINGNLVASNGISWTKSNPSTFYLGGIAVGDFYDGLIDEFGIWDRVLSPIEITYLYNNGEGRTPPYLSPEPSERDYYNKTEIDEMFLGINQKIGNLETENEQLNQEIENLREKDNLLELMILSLQSTFEEFVEKVMNYFDFMSISTKEEILCNTLEETGETQIEDLGLICELKKNEKCTCELQT